MLTTLMVAALSRSSAALPEDLMLDFKHPVAGDVSQHQVSSVQYQD
jgi:hypothetical protein